MAVSRRIAKTIVDKQSQSYVAGKQGGKDVMSIFSKDGLKTTLLPQNLIVFVDQSRPISQRTPRPNLTKTKYYLSSRRVTIPFLLLQTERSDLGRFLAL